MTSSKLPIIRYEFTSPTGDAIRIEGMQEYRPGDHSSRVDAYLIHFNSTELSEVQSFSSVLSALRAQFPTLDDDEVKLRTSAVWHSAASFPRLL